ncbi:MAG TPA: lysophospholipid acyltransferase family protein [Anaerolineales bacterium]|nr:lysophospholipid acyltransferase family protein [Anaerolineales bacterium]
MKIRESISYWLGVAALNRFTKRRLEMDVQYAAPIPSGPKIFACNHPTTTDPFYLLSVLPEKTRMMVNAEIFKKPIIGRLMRRAGHIPVNQKAGRGAVEAGIRALKAGDNLGIFPEGKLTDLEFGIDVDPLKTGAVRMALCGGAPIIPVGVYMPIDRITFKQLNVGGQQVGARFSFGGRYGITFGHPLWLSGDVEDRPLVHRLGEELREGIFDLTRLSALRLRNGLPLPERTSRKKKAIPAERQA